jgi:hypothetical protein
MRNLIGMKHESPATIVVEEEEAPTVVMQDKEAGAGTAPADPAAVAQHGEARVEEQCRYENDERQ